MRNIGTYKNFHFDGILNEDNGIITDPNKANGDISKASPNAQTGLIDNNNKQAELGKIAAEQNKKIKSSLLKTFFLEERDFDDDLDDEYGDIDPLDDGDGDPNTDLDVNMFGDDLDDEDELLDSAEFPNYTPKKEDIKNEKEPKQEVKSFFD